GWCGALAGWGTLVCSNPQTYPYHSGLLRDNVASIWDFYSVRAGLDSWNGAGAAVQGFADAGDGDCNAHAYPDGSGRISFDQSYSSLDIVGHEYTHLVDYAHGNLQQTSVLGEGFADSLGHLAAARALGSTTWLNGTDGPGSDPGCVGGW